MISIQCVQTCDPNWCPVLCTNILALLSNRLANGSFLRRWDRCQRQFRIFHLSGHSMACSCHFNRIKSNCENAGRGKKSVISITSASHGMFHYMHCTCNKPNGHSIDTYAMPALWVGDHVAAVASIVLDGFVNCHWHRQTPLHLPIAMTTWTTMTHSMMPPTSPRILNHCH